MSARDIFLTIQGANPSVKIVTKKEYRKLWKILDRLVRICTLGKNKTFLTAFTTTMGDIIAFPETWELDKVNDNDIITLKHELKHVAQYKKLGFGSVWFGFVLFTLLYLLIPFPIGLAWFRYKFERDAYATAWDTVREYRLNGKPNLDFYVECLTGSSYGWAWPFKKSVRTWFLTHIKNDKKD